MCALVSELVMILSVDIKNLVVKLITRIEGLWNINWLTKGDLQMISVFACLVVYKQGLLVKVYLYPKKIFYDM